MSLKITFRTGQIIRITGETEHFNELAVKTARAQGATLGISDEEDDRLIWPILERLEKYLVARSRAGEFRGPDMKKIVSAWIDQEIEAITE